MKLNKLQRHTAYIIMLAELEEEEPHRACFCRAICNSLDESNLDVRNSDIDIDFHLPELRRRKPDINYHYWFPLGEEGKQKRIELLKQCIEETY